MRSTIALPVLAVSLFVVVCPVHADDESMTPPKHPTAAEHLKRGNRHYRLRAFDRAVEEYKAGVAIEEAAVFWYNLAQSYRQLGRYEDALWYYERFRERGRPTGEVLRAVDAFITEMNAELERLAAARPPTEAAGDAGTFEASEPRRTANVPAARPIAQSQPPWYSDGVGWLATGTGLALAGVSTALFVSADSLSARADDEPDEVRRATMRDDVSTRRGLGAVAGVSGGLLLVAGVVKLASHSREPASVGPVTVSLQANSITLGWSF